MSTQKHQIGSRVNLLIVQVPGGLSNFIRRLAERLKENTVSDALKLMLASFTLFFQGETWRRGGWNSVEWWGLLHHHQSWVNFALPACYCYSSFGSSSGRNAIQTHNAVFTLSHYKANHKKLFQPNLGREVVEALGSLGCGSLSKVFLGWDSPWWKEGEGSVRIARSRCVLSSHARMLFEIDVSFLKGKNVKRHAFHKTGFIIYLDLLRFNTHVTACRCLDVSTL